ncbi:MAG: TVP38/TMEM64 family protein [Solobacterium sp.]|nr:TVP38/TMEM64 family protein [Solobacterium sp.]
MNLRSRKAVRVYFIIISLLVLALAVYVSIPLIRFIDDPERFRQWIASFGACSPIVYILVTAVSVIVSFVPGEPVELVAGYAFGSIKGMFYCMLAESLGSVAVLLLARKFGRRILEIFFDKEKIDSLKFLQSSKNRINLLTLIFTVPGTPKDLLCYVTGMTDIDIRILAIIVTLGRIPSIVTSTMLGGNLSAGNYPLAIAVIVITLVLSLGGIYIYGKVKERHHQEKAS